MRKRVIFTFLIVMSLFTFGCSIGSITADRDSSGPQGNGGGGQGNGKEAGMQITWISPVQPATPLAISNWSANDTWLTIDPDGFNPSLPADVTLDIEVSGGTAPYTYVWSYPNGGITNSPATNVQDPGTVTFEAAGPYEEYILPLTVTVKDSSRKQNTATATCHVVNNADV